LAGVLLFYSTDFQKHTTNR